MACGMQHHTGGESAKAPASHPSCRRSCAQMGQPASSQDWPHNQVPRWLPLACSLAAARVRYQRLNAHTPWAERKSLNRLMLDAVGSDCTQTRITVELICVLLKKIQSTSHCCRKGKASGYSTRKAIVRTTGKKGMPFCIFLATKGTIFDCVDSIALCTEGTR
jgi:hypothetical protein